MIQPVVVAAMVAVLGGIVAIAARDGRLVAVGLLLAMIASPLASSPEPSATAIVFRVIGSLLAAYLLWAAARVGSATSEGSGIGFIAEIGVAAAAFAVGWFVAPVKPLAGPLAAQAAGVALVAVAIVPLAGRDVLRIGTAAAVLVMGGSMLLEAWVGSASSLGQIVATALLVGIVGATSVLISPAYAPAVARPQAADAGAETEPGLPAIEIDLGPAPAGALAAAEAGAAGGVAASTGSAAARSTRAKATPIPGLAATPATGPMATRKAPKAPKRPRRKTASDEDAQAAAQTEPAAQPEAAGTPLARPMRVRMRPTRSVRGEDAAGAPMPPDDDAFARNDATPLLPPLTGATPNRVRRLRPREPRR